jgi:hypothetical protein
LLGGHPEPAFDGPVGQPRALDGGGIAGLELAQGCQIVGQVLLATSWERTLDFVGCQLAKSYRHGVPPIIIAS